VLAFRCFASFNWERMLVPGPPDSIENAPLDVKLVVDVYLSGSGDVFDSASLGDLTVCLDAMCAQCELSVFALFLHAIASGGCSVAFQQIKREVKVSLDPAVATDRAIAFYKDWQRGGDPVERRVFGSMADAVREGENPGSVALLCALVRFFVHPRFVPAQLLNTGRAQRSLREVSVKVIRRLFEASKAPAAVEAVQALKDAIRVFKVCCPYRPRAVFGEGGDAPDPDPERAHAELLLDTLGSSDAPPPHLVVALVEAYLPVRPGVEVLEEFSAGLLALCPGDGALPAAARGGSPSAWCTRLCYVFDGLSPHLSIDVRVRYLHWAASFHEGSGAGGLAKEELGLLARLGHLACWALPRGLFPEHRAEVENLFLRAVFAAVKDVSLALFHLLATLAPSEGWRTVDSLRSISGLTFDRRRDWDEAAPTFLHHAPVIRRFPVKDAVALLVPLLLCKKVEPGAARDFWQGVSSGDVTFIESFELEAFALVRGSAVGHAEAQSSLQLRKEECPRALAFLAGEIFVPAHRARDTTPLPRNQDLLTSAWAQITNAPPSKSITDYSKFRPIRAARGQGPRAFD
jgi:hypothetical protein